MSQNDTTGETDDKNQRVSDKSHEKYRMAEMKVIEKKVKKYIWKKGMVGQRGCMEEKERRKLRG